MRKKRMTAAEFSAQLAADPDYQALRRQQDAVLATLAATCAADEALLVAELQGAGYDIDSVWDLVNNTPHPHLPRRFLGPYPAAYPVLVKHLRVAHHVRIREGIIRALTVRDGEEMVERALLEEFEAESRPDLRWVLANALKYAMPYSKRRRRPDIAAAYRSPSGA
jgi:hypothetical protein